MVHIDTSTERYPKLHGTPASRGIALGKLTFLKRRQKPDIRHTVEDTAAEIQRFEDARARAITQLGNLYEASLDKLGEQNAVLFQIHQLMLDDPDYVSQIHEFITTEKMNAEYAVDVVAKRFSEMFKAMDNDYMQGRAADVIDVSRRVTDILLSSHGTPLKSTSYTTYGDEPLILATDDLAPSETVSLDKEKVTGIVTSHGSTRSHTVIFARTMGLPAVISLGDALSPDLEGHTAIVDGGAGILIIDPDESTIRAYRERKRTEDALRARLEQFRGKETRTLSGRRVRLYANIGSAYDLDVVKSSDAEGIGLFRSEYIYLSSDDFPTEETQFKIYKEVLESMEGRQVVIRTLDIGADKTAPYFTLKPEENPAMGMRAVRICITRPEIFKTQLRALFRASVYGNLAIMFPMITSVDELKACLAMCEEVRRSLDNEGIPYNEGLEIGIMIETPAAALISDELAPLVDFFSIGTNDLTQFTLAVDRQNAEVGRFLNPYHHAVRRLIEMTVKNAHNAGIWVGICGELAADEGFTHELIEMGVDELSVAPSSVLILRARISTLG
ncbi:MAG TPA: phosphoenolpyruvate--protein phosphotransferase [Candidatus Avisuccinivibrio pullicola]|nr:phosphoenolpyruvate--protein phosphotransferase [Candidatus Avisuccinivibrio pullicola]